jgi:hypothetical protein
MNDSTNTQTPDTTTTNYEDQKDQHTQASRSRGDLRSARSGVRERRLPC